MKNLGRQRRWANRAGAVARTEAALLRRAIDNLASATADTLRDYPLPRCSHGSALRDHSGEALEPSCGCRNV